MGYDGSEAARRALAHAADLAGYGSTLTVVNVWTSHNGSSRTGDGGAPLEDARAILSHRHQVGRYMAPAGDPAEELVAAARLLHADLLVIGKRNGGGGPGSLGSVSRRVVDEAPCDVLLVG